MKAITTLAVCLALAACSGNDDAPPDPAVPPATAAAGVIDKLEILSTVDAYGGATPPGAAGPYSVITGVVHGKLNPNHPDNAGIVDLKLAPAGADGYVSYSTDVVILRPKSAANARRILMYDVVNRGGKLNLSRHIGGGANMVTGTPPPATFPSLLQRGYTAVWSGWQGNVKQTGAGVTDDLGTILPVARNKDGTSITGIVHHEFISDNAGNVADIPLNYVPASLTDRSEVVFTARQSWISSSGKQDYLAPSVPVTTWNYVSNADGTVGVHFTAPTAVPKPTGGTEAANPGTIYSFVYRAKDPMVMGIGFAAVRDLNSFLRYADKDAQGGANPLNDMKTAACAAGTNCPANPSTNFDVMLADGQSQSGRYLRDFLYQGFNKAGNGGKVFDGLLPYGTGARRIWLNNRFAQPDRSSKQHEDHFMPGVEAPFTFDVRTDVFGTTPDGILKKCLETNTCPKVFELDGAMEWWAARGSLVVTDGAGHDIPLPDNVRYYYIASEQHTGNNASVTTGLITQPAAGTRCTYALNPVTQVPLERALVLALERWTANGTLPPPSTYPSVAAGQTSSSDRLLLGFPDLSNVQVPNGTAATPTPINMLWNGQYNQLFVIDYSQAVPKVDLLKQYLVLLPRVDSVGNDLGGIRLPEVAAPVATLTGWNHRQAAFSLGEGCALVGSAIPLAISAASKSPSDTRPTLASLYTGRADYQAKFNGVSDALVARGFLLSADVTNIYKVNSARISPLLIPNP